MHPVTAYDKNGIRVMLHFATDCPAGRPDVCVIVAYMLSTALLPVRDILLQAAVPKVKLADCYSVLSICFWQKFQ